MDALQTALVKELEIGFLFGRKSLRKYAIRLMLTRLRDRNNKLSKEYLALDRRLKLDK